MGVAVLCSWAGKSTKPVEDAPAPPPEVISDQQRRTEIRSAVDYWVSRSRTAELSTDPAFIKHVKALVYWQAFYAQTKVMEQYTSSDKVGGERADKLKNMLLNRSRPPG